MGIRVRDLGLRDIKAGRFASFEKELNADVVRAFSELVGDINPLHVDVDYGSGTSFHGNIVHGMLTSSLFSTLVGVLLPGKNALLGDVNLSFVRPVHVGTRVVVTGSVVSLLPGAAGFQLRLLAYDKGEVCVRGSAIVHFRADSVGVNEDRTVELDAVWEGNAGELLRTALVTGGSGLAGRAICLRLAREGWRVGIHYHQNKMAAEDVLREIMNEGGVGCLLKGDMSGHSEGMLEIVDECKEELGPIGLLVHTACAPFSPAGWIEPDSSLDLYTTQVRGFRSLLQAVLPNMLRVQKGQILTMLSDAIYPPYPKGWQSYIAVKSALQGVIAALASDYEQCGLTIGCITPGKIEGDSSVVVKPGSRSEVAPLGDEGEQCVSPTVLADAIGDIADGRVHFSNGSNLVIKNNDEREVIDRFLLESPFLNLQKSDAPIAEQSAPTTAAVLNEEGGEGRETEMRLVDVIRGRVRLDQPRKLAFRTFNSLS